MHRRRPWGIDDTAEVSVTLVDNEGIRELNRKHRDIDRETDVLSFPLGDDDGYEVDPDNDAIMLGDIVISLEKAAQQAEEYGHSYRREVAFLITHSLFHLLGYDHLDEGPMKAQMREHEEAIMKLLELER